MAALSNIPTYSTCYSYAWVLGTSYLRFFNIPSVCMALHGEYAPLQLEGLGHDLPCAIVVHIYEEYDSWLHHFGKPD